MDETTTDPAEVSTETEETTGLAGQESRPSGIGEAPARRVDEAEIAALREKLAASQARPHEYVKLLVALGDALGDRGERVERYREAANLYSEKGNKAEATKVYEKLFEADPTDQSARAFLREAYEAQRKYDKLVDMMMAEARALEPGPEQAEAYKQVAILATERIKKPELCIDLWNLVLAADAEDADALGALVQLYERSRDYEQLANALEKLQAVTYDEGQRVEHLNKLGQIVGDRLKDDVRAAEAYRMLLTLRPDDRRAQEQLKKRYVTLGRWDDLEVFYAESGNWDEFIRLLESNEAREENVTQRIAMLAKAAELWMTQKGKPDRASRSLEKILSIDEKNLEAADRLIPIYEEANNPKGLVTAIEVKLGHTEEVEERLALLLRAAALYDERLRDKPKALAHLLEGVALDPARASTFEQAETVAKAAKAWQEVVDAYRKVLPSVEGSESEVEVRLRLGRVLSEEMGNVDDALAEYRTVYDEHPDNQAALSALETLYQKTEGWAELLEVYQQKLELPLDPQERKATQYGIAAVQREQMGELKLAIATYEEVLGEDEDDMVALEALDGLYQEAKKYKDQARIIGERITRAPTDEELVTLKFRLAEVQSKHLKNAAGALANYREVLQLDLNHGGAREALEAFLDVDALRGEAAQILEAVFETREDWAPLVRVLEVRASVAEDVAEKVELLRKLARVTSENLGKAGDAFDAQARALHADPTSDETRQELEALAAASGAWKKLAETFQTIAGGTEDSDLALGYWVRLAELERQQGQVDLAAQAYEKALAIEPAHQPALTALDDLFRGASRFDDLVKVYRRRIALAEEPTVAEGLYVEMARVLEVELQKPDAAIEAYREVLEQQPDSTLVLRSLDELFSRLGRADDLARNLESQLELAADDEDWVRLTLRLAGLRESQMSQVDAAIEGYKAVLDRDPGQETALSSLERLFENPACELTVAEILEPLYRSAGDHGKLIRVHEVQVRRATDAGRKVELLGAIAELHEDAAGDLSAAFDTMARALAADPSSEKTLENLSRLASATERFVDLARITAEQADQVTDVELKCSLYMFSAQVLEDSVGDPARAIALYKLALAASSSHVPAAEALERLYQATEQFAEMSAVLQQKATMLDDLELQKKALYEAARLQEDVLERPEGAISVYEKVLALDAEDLRSVESLIGLFLGLSRWEDLLRAYTRKVDLIFDADEKKQVLYEVGAVYERELASVERAIDTYQRVLELDPDDLIALGRLDVLYQTAGNWQELLSVLTREAELTADPEESVGYQYRVARLHETRLGDVERAIELYRDVLGIQTDHEAALGALEELQQGTVAPLAASAVLEQVYEAAGDADRLVRALEVQVKHADGPAVAVELLQRIATLEEEGIGAPERAFATYARAVALDSQRLEVLESFERLATVSENWRAVAQTYDKALASLAEAPELVVDLGLRVAQVYEVQLDDVESAIARYRTVVEAEPESTAALGALDRLYEQTERYAELADILAREAEFGATPDEILEFKFRLAQTFQHRLRRVDQAIDSYREVLAAAPEHEGSLEALEALFAGGTEVLRIAEVLEPLYQASGEWEKLLDLREGELGQVTGSEERVNLFRQMAEDAEVKLVDVDRAFGYLIRSLKEAPSVEQTQEELARLAPAADDGWSTLAGALSDVMQKPGAAASTVSLVGQHLARIAEVELLDVDRAVRTYRFVLSVAPADAVALENLDRIFTDAERYYELAQVLEVRAKVAEEEFDKVDLYLRLGHTYEEKLAPLGAAAAAPPVMEAPKVAPPPPRQPEPVSVPPEEIEPSLDDLLPADEDEDLDAVAQPVDDGFEAIESEPPQAASAAEELAEDEGAVEYNQERLQDAIVAYRVVFDRLQKDNQDAIESLERCYQLTREWTNLDVVYQRQLEHTAGDSDEADVRAKRARLSATHLGLVDAAVEGWKRVLHLRGEDPEALRELAFLYEKQGKWSELTDVLERHFDIAETDEDRVHVLTMRARLFDEQLNRDDEALENYKRVLDIDFSNVTALRAISKIWRRRKNDEELAQALHAMVDQAGGQLPEKELVETFRELAKLHQDKLDQLYEGTDAWRRLLEVGPGDFEALQRLEAIYRADEQWTEVIDVKMQRASALAEPAEKVRELLEVTDLWKTTVREYDRSVEAYNRILEADPIHDQAFKELEKLHSHANRWEPLIELYLNRLEHLVEVPARSDLLRRIARVFDEHLHDQDQAFDALVNAFADDYFDDETAAALSKVAQSTGRWGELLTTANTWLKDEKDRKTKIQLSLRLGKWYGEDLGRPSDAMAYYHVVLEIDPNNTRVMRQMAAIERLAGNYSKAGQMLNKALEVAVANEDRKVILGDLGEILFRNLDQVDQAIGYYKRALDVDDGYMPALVALERIYDDRNQVPELVAVLTKKSRALDRPEDAVPEKLRLGELLENRLSDLSGATKAYREALDLDDSNITALRGLERTLGGQAQWGDLVTILERQLDVVDTERDRVVTLLRLADVQENQFLKADIAAQRLEQALAIDHTQEGAYVSLARCYRRLKQWNDLVDVYRRHLDETLDRGTKVELYAAIGAVYRDELSDVDQAIDSFQAVVDADETNIPALEALSKLYEKQGDAARSIEMMTRVAELTVDGGQKVDMYYRIGRAMEEKLSDRYGAREKFELALDLEPRHLPSLGALRTIAVDEADWDGACQYLDQEQQNTEAPRQRARLLVELAKIKDEMLSEHEAAISAYEQAIGLDGDCEEAALPLVHEYSSQGRFADAAPLAEMLTRKSKNLEKTEQQTLHKLLGSVMAKLGEHEKALKAYQTAHQLDLTDQETVRGMADAAYSLEDWPTSLTNYQKVLTSLGEEDIESRTDVYWRLGKIKQAQGQDRQAINNYEKALALDGEHRPSLDSLVEVYGKSGENKLVAEYKRQILDTIFDGEQRFTMLMDIGDLWAGKENDPLKALEAYEEARDLKPQDHVLLHKMVQNYQKAQEWQKMVDVLDAIKEVEERPKLKAKLINTQAQIYRDMLDDKARAVELFNEALDLDPEFLEAFERINKILTAEKNWKQLERSYRKMLHRIAGKGKQDLEHQLWHQLGLIYRDRTAQTQEAIEAFRMSSSLVAEAPLQRKILAELYEGIEQWDDAIKEQRVLLRGDPLNIDPYQALYRLYLHKQAYDEAWALAAAMAFMGKADADQDRFFQDYRPQGMLQVSGRLANEHWERAIIHPHENRHISEIFKFIVRPALQAKLAQLKAQGKLPKLDDRFRQDPATSTVTFAKTFGWASQVLGIQPPALYVRNDVQAYIGAVAAEPPACVAGQLVLSGLQPQELTFVCGKHLTLYRPEHYLKALFPTQAELTVMLFAAIMLVAPQQPLPPDMESPIRSTAQEIGRHIQPVELEGLKQAVKSFLADGAKVNIKQWSHAVEHTACRAGLILCCDLNVAKKIIGSEQQVPGDLTPQEKLKELLVFATSIEYSALRKAMGVAVYA